MNDSNSEKREIMCRDAKDLITFSFSIFKYVRWDP